MSDTPHNVTQSPARHHHQRLQRIPTVDLGPLGTALAPGTLTDLTQCLNHGSNLSVLAWRGQADSKWLIDSTLVRRLKTMKWILRHRATDEPNAVAAERALINRTRVAGHGVLDGRELSDLEILALLRHHGAATRLLDCTRNAYIACWFAATQRPDDMGMVIGFAEHEPFFIDSQEKVQLRIEDLLATMNGRLGFWSPSWLSPRIAAQHAVFVFGTVTSNEWGSLPLKAETPADAGSVPGSLVIALKPELKEQLIDQLHAVHGLTRERLFPDLDGFASTHSASVSFPNDLAVDWVFPDVEPPRSTPSPPPDP